MRVKLFCPPALVAVTVAASLTLAACGSGDSGSSAASGTGTQSAGSSTTGTSGTGRGMMTAAAQACLKKEGVTLPSRPAGTGGGGYGDGGTPPQGGGYGLPGGTGGPPQGGTGSGGFGGTMTDAQRTKMQAALKKCGVTFGQGQGGPYGGTGAQRPDTSSKTYQAAVTKYTACVRQNGYDLPDPDFSGKGPIFAAKIQQDAKFQAASKQCQSILSAAMGGARQGGATNGQQPATTTGTSNS
jgi:hypothetical protein